MAPMSNHEQAQDLPSNFIRTIIDKNLKDNLYQNKRWAGSPGGASHQN